MTNKKQFIIEHGGYIGLFRSLRDDPLWKIKPFSKGQAWVDLLMLANHKTIETISGGEVVRYYRGTVCRSMSWLAEEWGWDRRKVRRFLMALENDGRLSVKVLQGGTTNGVVISIENYNKFQCLLTADGTTDGTTDSTTDGTTDGTQTKMTKNEKKDVRAGEDETPRDVIPMPDYIRQKMEEVF